MIERFSVVMIGLFTILTLASLYFLQFTQYQIEVSDILSGLTFELPRSTVAIAIGAFGITGVGGDEIIHYTYWCLEKGYAQHTGPDDGSEEWKKRAHGWINIMYLDAIIAMVIYTLMTAAFYLLGAAILYHSGDIPEGYGMLDTLSTMYTETLGRGARSIFLLGAIIVLFSTLFSSLAAWTRQYSDLLSQIGLIDFIDPSSRSRAIQYLSWVLAGGWFLLFMFISLPVMMIIFGGIITSIILLLIIYMAIYFRYVKNSALISPSRFYDFVLWTSIVVIISIAIYGIVKLI